MTKRTKQTGCMPDSAKTETDNEKSRRSTINSAIVAAEQRYERSDRNPLYVWDVVWMCTQPNEQIIPLPQWCADYLHQAADNLIQLSAHRDFRRPSAQPDSEGCDTAHQLELEQVVELVPQALFLTRPGTSAFKRAASDADKITRMFHHDDLRMQGVKAELIPDEIGKRTRKWTDFDATRKAVAAGRKLVAHIPARFRCGKRGKN